MLQQTIRQSHALTVLQEVEAWEQCEEEAEEADFTQRSSPIPALVLTRGRKDSLFNSNDTDSAALESAWDKGLARLYHRLASQKFDVSLVSVQGGGLRLPLYRPQAVATAIHLVTSPQTDGGLKERVSSLPITSDPDDPQGVLKFNLLK